MNFAHDRFIITAMQEEKMKEITLRIKNDQLAETLIDLIRKVKGVEIFEQKQKTKKTKRSKIWQILENPYDVKNFKIHKREEVYEETGIH